MTLYPVSAMGTELEVPRQRIRRDISLTIPYPYQRCDSISVVEVDIPTDPILIPDHHLTLTVRIAVPRRWISSSNHSDFLIYGLQQDTVLRDGPIFPCFQSIAAPFHSSSTEMMRRGVLRFVLATSLVFSRARGFVISNFLPPGSPPPNQGAKVVVSWSRDPEKDPIPFVFAWIAVEPEDVLQTGSPVNIADTTTGGTTEVTYPHPGVYRLAVFAEPLDRAHGPIAKGDEKIYVKGPVQESTTSSVLPSSSITSVASSTNTQASGSLTSSQVAPSDRTEAPSSTDTEFSVTSSVSTSVSTESASVVSSATSPAPTATSDTEDPPGDPAASPTDSSQSGGSTTSKTKVGTIAGAVIGSIAGVVLLSFALLLLLRHRRRKNNLSPSNADDPETFSRERMIKGRDSTPLHEATSPSEASHTQEYAAIPTIVLPTDTSESKAPSLSRGSSIDDTTTVGDNRDSYVPPPLPGTARTDRQMQIENKIMELNGDLIRASSPGGSAESSEEAEARIGGIRERIEKLRGLMDGDWAREVSDEIPAEVVG